MNFYMLLLLLLLADNSFHYMGIITVNSFLSVYLIYWINYTLRLKVLVWYDISALYIYVRGISHNTGEFSLVLGIETMLQ